VTSLFNSVFMAIITSQNAYLLKKINYNDILLKTNKVLLHFIEKTTISLVNLVMRLQTC